MDDRLYKNNTFKNEIKGGQKNAQVKTPPVGTRKIKKEKIGEYGYPVISDNNGSHHKGETHEKHLLVLARTGV